MNQYHIIMFVIGVCLLGTLVCEAAEHRVRRDFYLDQWLLRGSGFCFGAAIATTVCALIWS